VSYVVTPAETPLSGTSRVPTRESQSSISQPTKSRSPRQSATVPSTAPTSQPSSHGSADERPHQVKFMLSDSPEDSPPTTPELTTPQKILPDPNDPYRRSKRKPPTTNLAEIPDRFHFDKVTKKRQSQQLHYFDQSLSGPHSSHAHSNHSSLLHNLSNKSLKDHFKGSGNESSGEELHEEYTGSQVSLRRFFRGGQKKGSRPTTPISPSTPTITPMTSANRRPSTPPPQKSSEKNRRSVMSTMPFGDDHAGLGLSDKYGKFGKVLGAGAGGSVRLMKRASDGTTFAVKEFRARGEHETQREYAKKVNAEFTIGSILSHQNIVETLDIVNEGGRYFEVMEYCRYDLVPP
jgi:Protein kinase domain